MDALKISLLGGVHVAHAAGSAESKVSPSVQALLAYLLLQGHRSHSRDALAGLFWGEHRQDQARSCLSTTLWRLRGVLEPAGVPRGTYLAITPLGEVSFNWLSKYWLDVAVFEEHVGRSLVQRGDAITATNARELQEALHLYTGELLEGFYADWALREREHLRALYLSGLQRLMEYYQQQGMYAESLACGQLILQYEPLREDIHRQIMQLHSAHGQRALAVRQYELCRDLLAAELGIAPLEETQTLYAQLIILDGSRPATAAGSRDPMNLQQALQQVRAAMQGLDAARERLQWALQHVEHLTKDQ
jgi:DNA-binding SARP family transcriptional activator